MFSTVSSSITTRKPGASDDGRPRHGLRSRPDRDHFDLPKRHNKTALDQSHLQFCSSLPSWQSKSPSQIHVSWIHSSPVAHAKWWLPQRLSWQPCSSDWSSQSAEPSHRQLSGMHIVLFRLSTHLNSFSSHSSGAANGQNNAYTHTHTH